jgi:hypothetical protein
MPYIHHSCHTSIIHAIHPSFMPYIHHSCHTFIIHAIHSSFMPYIHHSYHTFIIHAIHSSFMPYIHHSFSWTRSDCFMPLMYIWSSKAHSYDVETSKMASYRPKWGNVHIVTEVGIIMIIGNVMHYIILSSSRFCLTGLSILILPDWIKHPASCERPWLTLNKYIRWARYTFHTIPARLCEEH